MRFTMFLLVPILIVILVMLIGRLLSQILRRVTVHDYEAGLHYVSGRLRRSLPPGG